MFGGLDCNGLGHRRLLRFHVFVSKFSGGGGMGVRVGVREWVLGGADCMLFAPDTLKSAGSKSPLPVACAIVCCYVLFLKQNFGIW